MKQEVTRFGFDGPGFNASDLWSEASSYVHDYTVTLNQINGVVIEEEEEEEEDQETEEEYSFIMDPSLSRVILTPLPE